MKKKYFIIRFSLLVSSFFMSATIQTTISPARSTRNAIGQSFAPVQLAQNSISTIPPFVPKSNEAAQATGANVPLFKGNDFILPLELQEKKSAEEKSAAQALEVIAQKTADEALLEPSHSLEEEKIEFQFEDADLQTLITQVGSLFNYTFLTDEMIQPLGPDGKAIKGAKISFKTERPLAKQEAWNLFLTFLDISGFAALPYHTIGSSQSTTFRIKTKESTLKEPTRTFINTDYTKLPDSDEIIRYLYFIENGTLESIMPIVNALKSSSSGGIELKENKAFLLIDKSYNIKKLMEIVKELDKVTIPQSMSVLKLRHADCQKVKELCDALAGSETAQPGRLFAPRKQATSLYFPESTKIIAEPRTNSLILLGGQNAIRKIEKFIVKHVDVAPDQPSSPLYVHNLKFAKAEVIADIMNNLSKFGQNTPAGQSGGVRGQDKYLKSMAFIPEKETNRLVIKGDYDDVQRALEIIKELDVEPVQVAVELLVIDLKNTDAKELGVQLRSKENGHDGLTGSNIKFQTSGLRAGATAKGIVENTSAGPGIQRLLGNLLTLVTKAGPANTVITLGRDSLGVWGIFQALQQITDVNIVQNPFMIISNKTRCVVSVGESRRVVTSTVAGAGSNINSLGDNEAALMVDITPQINSDGMITLKIVIDIKEFTDQQDKASASKAEKHLETTTTVANNEVIALGGFKRQETSSSLSKTPFLGDIPGIGLLFKNRRKAEANQDLLVLLSTRIIPPDQATGVNTFTKDHIALYQKSLAQMQDLPEKRDPVSRMFFADHKKSNSPDKILLTREKRISKARARRRRAKEKYKQSTGEFATNPTAVPLTTSNFPSHIAPPLVDRLAKNAENESIVSKSEGKRLQPLSTALSSDGTTGVK